MQLRQSTDNEPACPGSNDSFHGCCSMHVSDLAKCLFNFFELFLRNMARHVLPGLHITIAGVIRSQHPGQAFHTIVAGFSAPVSRRQQVKVLIQVAGYAINVCHGCELLRGDVLPHVLIGQPPGDRHDGRPGDARIDQLTGP